MKLSKLIPMSTVDDPEIAGLHYDSRKIKKSFLFFAIPGFNEDGAKYLPDAFAAGAIAAVVSEGARVPDEFLDRCFFVKEIRKTLAEAAKIFFQYQPMHVSIGVTGTKGKTSTSFLLESILSAAEHRAALVGGVECRYPGWKMESKLTTMDSLELQSFLSMARKAGTNALSMEVSSHALSLDRVWGLEFDGMVFTNLSEDHLDFYSNMEEYFSAKKILFKPPYRKGPAAANVDDSYGRRLVSECPGDWITFGLKNGDVRAESIFCTDRETSFTVVTKQYGDFPVHSTLAGEFNIINILGAVAISLRLGFTQKQIQSGIKGLRVVPGRLERVETSLPISVFVDFAHMGHALENVLKSLRPLCRGRLIAVFGAGGDRPVERREQLGSVAAKFADYTVITSDNPRTEDPQKIILAVERAFLAAGGKKESYWVESDRNLALRGALTDAQPGDVVCIAGKGHETGQIIGQTVFPFDDRVVAARILRELEKRVF